MRARPLHLWLLALTFVVGQWLAVVHGVQHRVNGGDPRVACEVCAVGQAAAGPPQTALPLALLPARVESPRTWPNRPLGRTPNRRPPARGPPHFLA